jgi:hypothetical protein
MTASIALLSFAAQSSGVLQAQTPTSSEEQRGPILADIQSSIIRIVGTEGYAAESFEITAPGSVLTVSRINSQMNTAAHAERNTEAKIIASIVSRAISGQPTFKTLVAIHVRYVVRPAPGEPDKVLDTVEFRKNSNGEFIYHVT